MSDFIITEAQELFRNDSPRAKAPAPAVGLKTGISRALVYPGFLDIQAIAAAADGSLWTATRSELQQYSAAVNRPVKVCDMTYYKPSPLSLGRYIAPVSNQRAFFIQSRAGKRVVSQYVRDTGVADRPALLSPTTEFPSPRDPVSDLPLLPEGDTPGAVSAAADGTLWVLGNSGKPWLYDSGGSWKPVPAEAGTSIKQISAGSASFVLAVAETAGRSRVLRYSNGAWVDYITTAPANLRWVGACGDGFYWWSSADYTSPGELHLVRPGLADVSFHMKSPAFGFTGANRRCCYFLSMEMLGFARASYGVLDQPPEAWPAMNLGESKGYSAISDRLGIKDPNGIRSQYSSAIAPFSTWFERVSEMGTPAGVSKEDWESIREQIKDELEYVQALAALFINLALLNNAIGLVHTNTYNQVVKMVELPDQPSLQPKTLVSIIFDKLVGKLEGAITDKAKAFMGSEVVDIGMACFKYAGNMIAKEHSLPDGSVPLKIACSELASTLADAVVKAEKARADFQKEIFGDWGKLGACGEAIRSGLWFWQAGLSYETLKETGAAIALDFYQTLMPAKWKIILVQGLMAFQPPLDPFMHNVPAYSLIHKYISDKQGNRLYWWWACAEVGSRVEQQNEGPYPNRTTMQAIFKLDTNPLDFFTGQNGWALGMFEAAGYRPPPDGVPWQPWIDSDKPMG